MGEIVGMGELTLIQILNELFPTSEIVPQEKLSKLMSGDYKNMSSSSAKQTLDVVIYPPRSEVIVCRVQGKDHLGLRKSSNDLVQKRILESNRCKVLDFWFSDCPVLFLDKKNKNSEYEVKMVLKRNGIKF